MIRFALKCNQDHSFESWFQSGTAFDKVKGAGMVVCPTCGSTDVEKTLMAPRVQTKRKTTVPSSAKPRQSEDLDAKIAALKKHVEANSDYVGASFAKEARAMHSGEKPERSIYGEANLKDAASLIEEGVSLAPLPFIPTRKSN
ncbi:DUF1178 family protein [Falsihalocynthiibacter sp. SS001]|uniref:DUF1178 family protein n=1 Tax=Falsihalocynthiibacter sp. SS001 TaxID=3349698 RepID=UPI0036D349B1